MQSLQLAKPTHQHVTENVHITITVLDAHGPHDNILEKKETLTTDFLSRCEAHQAFQLKGGE